MMIILPYQLDAELLLSASDNSLHFLFMLMAWRFPTPHVMSILGLNQHRENKMKKLLITTAAPATAMFALAFLTMATPASAAEFCRQDATSGMRGCGYVSLEQCRAASSGIGGTCYRDPYLADNSSANAYAPKNVHPKGAAHPVKKPVDNQ
jgi:hypothetical protein